MAHHFAFAPVFVLAASLFGAITTVPTSSAQEQAPEHLNLTMFAPEGPTAITHATGALADAGIDVSVNITPSSTEQMRGLSDGTYDLAYTAFDNVLAWSGREGATIVAVAQTDQEVTLPIVVRPEIRDWSDLRGHALAVDAPETAFALVLRRVLLAHGLDLSQGDYSFIPYGAPAARLQSMLKGDTFGAILNPPTDRQAVAQGMRAFGDQHDVLPEYPGGVIAVRRDWAEDNRQVLVRFLRAWRDAGDFSQAEPDAAAELFASDAHIPPGQAAGSLPVRFESGRINPAGLQTVLDLRNEFGYELPMGPNLSVYLDTSYWAAAALLPAQSK